MKRRLAFHQTNACSLRRVSAALALPQIAFAQEAALSGTVTDSTGGVLPGVTITAVHAASGNSFVGGHRRARSVPSARAQPGPISSRWSCRASRPSRDRVELARRADGGRQRSRWRRPTIRNRSPSPARRRSSTPPRRRSGGNIDPRRCRSCRSTAATGWTWRSSRRAAAERGEQHPAIAPGLLADQHRRPADHAPDSRHRSESAQLQHGRDRGVRARHQPLRCHAGPFGRNAGERHHEVRHQHLRGHASPASSATTASTPPTSSSSASCRTRTSR